MKSEFDIVIVGAGPAGSTAAIALYKSGLSIALVDKATFPRDKICGDAISPDVVNQLNKLPFEVGKSFEALEEKTWSRAVRFVSPNYTKVDISLNQEGLSGYVSPRMAFDELMYRHALRNPEVTDFTGSKIASIQREADGIKLDLGNDRYIFAKMVLAADGSNSQVKRTLQPEEIDRKHHCAGLRMYYEGVSGFSEDHAVELHFYKELLPGYFWVFPMPNGKANVGIGMLSEYISKKNVDLKKELAEIINSHPNVSHRFKHARPLESAKGFPLPLGSKKRKISGDNYLLLGDAASLINPLSGEGIGNAIRSGRVAADHVKTAFESQQFDGAFNRKYDREIYDRMWGELRLNYWIQRLMRSARLSNFFLKYTIGSKFIQDLVLSGFSPKKLWSLSKRSEAPSVSS